MNAVVTGILVAGGIAGSLTAIGLAILSVYRVVRQIIYIANAVSQLLPNGGSSMADRVKSTKETVESTKKTVDSLDKRVQKLEEYHTDESS